MDLHDVARFVIRVAALGQQFVWVLAASDFDECGPLQCVVAQCLGGAGCADLLRLHPAIAAVVDLALVGQGDGCQLAVLVAVALGAAIRVLVALQLTVGVEALPCLVAEAVASSVPSLILGFGFVISAERHSAYFTHCFILSD